MAHSFDLISDTHFDFFNDAEQIKILIRGLNKGSDTLIIAGDFCEFNSPHFDIAIDEICKIYRTIIYVLGNHEWYGLEYDSAKILDAEDNIKKRNPHTTFRILNDFSVVINDVEYVGATGWFPETKAALNNIHLMNDFVMIENFKPFQMNANTKFVFSWMLAKKTKADKRVVITHHLPCFESINAKWLMAPTNCYYNSQLYESHYEFDCWVHGHTHDAIDYYLNDKRIVCNPTGYYCQPMVKTIYL